MTQPFKKLAIKNYFKFFSEGAFNNSTWTNQQATIQMQVTDILDSFSNCVTYVMINNSQSLRNLVFTNHLSNEDFDEIGFFLHIQNFNSGLLRCGVNAIQKLNVSLKAEIENITY